jgi:hypothetical protein
MAITPNTEGRNMDKTTDSIKWARIGSGYHIRYNALVSGRWYSVRRAPYSGWMVWSANPRGHWRHDGYLRTLADGKAWAESQREAVAA